MTSQANPRLARLRARMADTGTDLVLLGASSHLRWLTGLDPHGDERPVLLAVTADHAGLLIPGLNADDARRGTDLAMYTYADDEGPDAELRRLLADCDALRPELSVAIDETIRADHALLALDALQSPRRRFTGDTVGALRAVKEPAEIAALKACSQLNDRALLAGLEALKPGVRERDVRQAIIEAHQAGGAVPAFCIVAFGPNTALPHHHTSDAELQDDMPVLIDTGCVLDGYLSDITRCKWIGDTPDPDYLTITSVLEQANAAAQAAARTGVTAASVDLAARDVVEAAGYGPRFLHRTGHGVGIDVHEPPYVTRTSPTVLESGHVFSIEPGIYLEGRFGVRLENVVVLKDSGAEPLSDLPLVI
ncbi:MAG: Xaa-Pro peptidase family protein [Rhodobacter sp.]|nr:Xaa-Pro peptidase family protein [Rhodobacter sp.]